MNKENYVIGRLFEQVALSLPQKVCLQIKKEHGFWEKWTYRQLEELSKKVGAFLLSSGLKKADTACLIMENRPEWAAIYLGITSAGLICVPLDPELSKKELEKLISDSGCRILFISQKIFSEKNNFFPCGSLDKVIVLQMKQQGQNLIDFSHLKDFSVQGVSWPEVYPEDIASLIYTSGTTGQPKGVLLSHANLCSNFISLRKLNLISESDNFLSILSLYHTYSFMVTLLVPLLAGAKITFFAGFKPEDLSAIIKEAEITVFAGVPQIFSMIHKAVFEKIKTAPFFLKPLIFITTRISVKQYFGKNLRFLVSGGARLEPAIGRDLSRLGLKIIEGYGLTETSPVVCLNPPLKVKFGSVGRPIPGVSIKIVQADPALIRQEYKGSYPIGEILIKGPNLMKGYFKQQAATDEAIKQGWFYSGDLGFIDSDGFLFLLGRKKELIVLGSGKNIYPEELEDYYSRSPYIKELCILSKKEKRFGNLQEFLYAVIVPDLEYFASRNEKNIRAKIRWEIENLGKDLPGYKHIMGLIITRQELPRTNLRKIKRYSVAEKYLKEQPLTHQPKADESSGQFFNAEEGLPLAKKIIDYLSEEIKRPVNLNSHLEIDLGIDSLGRVDLGLGLQKRLKIKIPDETILNVTTVRDIISGILDLESKAYQDSGVPQGKERNWHDILSEPLPQPLLKKIRLSVDSMGFLTLVLFKNILLIIFRLFWLLRIEGRNNIPAAGPYILCPNHASYLDGPFVFSALPLRSIKEIFFIGDAAIFHKPLLRLVMRLSRIISIDPVARLIPAMQAASYVLKNGKIICIFPEGYRSIDTQVQEFKKGIGILVKELDIPAIPVYIKNSHYSWPRAEKFLRPYPVKIIFGKPLKFNELISPGRKSGAQDDYDAVARAIREELIKLDKE